MRITQFTDYALRVLLYLAGNDGRLVTIQEIAEYFDISALHLRKIVTQLSELGHVETVRGRSGGVRLAREPEAINLGELFRKVENLRLLPCFECKDSCPIRGCKLKSLASLSLNRFLAEWDSRSLADVM